MAVHKLRLVSTLSTMALIAGGFGIAGTGLASASSSTLFASPGGSASNAGTSCATAKYSTIQSAVNAASPSDTVRVCHGTYHEAVLVQKTLKLEGSNATVDASGQLNGVGFPVGIMVLSSWTQVSGFSVENAGAEGILVATYPPNSPTVTHVTIEHNSVHNNDLAGGVAANDPECAAQGQVPGDCGEGLHLLSVTHSRAVDNKVWGNSGGILLTDEFGPNHDNLVADNWVANNVADCGITIPSHVAGNGVYHNVIRDNVVIGNGTQGDGGGILIAAAGPGMASWGNLVTGNFVVGNGLAGVTIHSHAPGQNVSDNTIVGNFIGKNNLLGDGGLGVGGTATDTKTTGILVSSAVVPQHLTIEDNTIWDNTYGVWLSSNITAHRLGDNTFKHVTQKVFVGP
jgi:nitrous oxidase accessory protein NosD